MPRREGRPGGTPCCPSVEEGPLLAWASVSRPGRQAAQPVSDSDECCIADRGRGFLATDFHCTALHVSAILTRSLPLLPHSLSLNAPGSPKLWRLIVPAAAPVTALHPRDHPDRVYWDDPSEFVALHINAASNNLSAPTTRGFAAKPTSSLRGAQLPAD